MGSFAQGGHLEGRGLDIIIQRTGNAIKPAIDLLSGTLLRLVGKQVFIQPGSASSLVPCKPPQAGTERTATRCWLSYT